MGYGRNALWLAGQGYQVEGWETDRRYLAEARRQARWLRLRVRFRWADFTRARFTGPYAVIVIANALHQVRRSQALGVLRRARAALGPGGQLFLLVKLTRDRYFQRTKKDPSWAPMPGERNTLRRLRPPGPPKFWRGRQRKRRWVLSVLTPTEIKRALRGLRVRRYRELVLRSDWDEPRPVTHCLAELVAERPKPKV